MVQTLILDNSAVEDVEQFLVFISPVVGLFPVAVQDSTAVVTITDDDGRSLCGSNHKVLINLADPINSSLQRTVDPSRNSRIFKAGQVVDQ